MTGPAPSLPPAAGLPVWRKALALLSPADRRRAGMALLTSLLAAVTSGAVVWSLLPFLRVLVDPEAIGATASLRTAHDLLGQPQPYVFLLILGAVSILLVIAASAAQVLNTLVLARFAATAVQSLGHRLLDTYLHQPYEFFLGRHSAGLAANMLSESEEAVRQYFRPVIELASASLTTLAVTLVLAWINAPVALLAALLLGGAYGSSYVFFRRRMRRLGRLRSAANQQRYRVANESLQSIKDVKVLGRETAYLSRFADPARQVRDTNVRLRLYNDVPRYILQASTYCAVVLFCVLFVSRADFESGRALRDIGPLLGVFAFAGQRLIPEVQRLFGTLATLQFGAAAVDRLHDDLAGHAVAAPPPPGPRLRLTRSLGFDGVGYAYPGAAKAGVTDLTFEIRASEKIGIVGSSGAGKSTLGDLVLGLLDPVSGRIAVDGVQITAANRRAWQQSVGFVPQDIFLGDASVAENIALGLAPDHIDMVQVRRCAAMASVDEVIAALPEGYDTHVGERGVRLSGGQRQRLAIARALYQDADLIVFDEATSALDTLTEAEVMAALDALPGEKTILIVAHRLSTLDICDRILVLEQGRLVGFGPREALMAACPEFRRLSLAGGEAARRA